MVAGRRSWGHNEQRSSQHQASRRGDLGVEAVVDDGLRSREAGGRRADVEARRQIDEERHGEAEQAEPEDDASGAVPALVAHRDERERTGQERHRNQQVGMRFAGGLGADGGSARGGQPGVAGLADLHRPVVDELGGDQATR